MQLIFNPRSGNVTLNGERIIIDLYYPIDDEYRLIFRGKAQRPVIQLVRGNKTVQTVTIPTVSAVAGRNATGTPIPQFYQIDIVPPRPIFPQRAVISRLLEMGLTSYQIHIMNAGQTLNEYVSAHAVPQMVCATRSAFVRTEVPACTVDGLDLADGVKFTVDESAKWAILYNLETPVGSVYLWPDVVDDADAFIAKVEEMNAE